MLRRALLAATVVVLLTPGTAPAGFFQIENDRIVFAGEAVDEKISGFDTGMTIRFTRFGGPSLGGGPGCNVSDDNQTVDCQKSGVRAVELNLGAGDDVASVSLAVMFPVFFNGGDGNDGLFGGGGVDSFDGGPGNDNIVARDGHSERVECASGNDTAITDDADVRVSCEQVEGDADGDGVRRPADCDDTKPQIRPGSPDAPDDGIDQDCSGADATNLDRDADGFPVPQDCDDRNAAIRPGARETRGNAVDENCDEEIVPFPPLAGSVANAWLVDPRGTRNLTLKAKGFPRRTRIRMRCSGPGCSLGDVSRRVKSRRRAVDLHRFLGNSRLRPGARLTLRFSRKGHVGRVLRYRIKSGALPGVDFLCQRPGRKARPC
jgi:Putative metal-binding motif